MSFNTAAFELLESRRTVPAVQRSDAGWLFADLQALLGDVPPSWFEEIPICDRRSESRFHCDHEALLTPLDEGLSPLERQPIPVHVEDVSQHGVGLRHPMPLPFRLVQIEFIPGAAETPALVVRLHWCRFRDNGTYESGGRIQRVVAPEDSAGGLPEA